MKVPLQWLGEYVSWNVPVPRLAERLTLAGLEVVGYRFLGVPIPPGIHVKPEDQGPEWLRDKVVTARIVKVEQHANADRLKLVTLEYGAKEPKVVVTGAPNINVGDSGQKVILGLCGTRYFDGHVSPKQIKELKPSTLRGVPSDAMVMSEYELGITEEHEGIIVLEADAPVGMPLVDYMGDAVLEVDVLPNMARCLSMIGIAREVSALMGTKLTKPDLAFERAKETIEGLVKVSIADPKLSARYQATLIRNVKEGPAPCWMQRRLIYSGMRPISNVVDITNYVMLEWGQPLHAFDYDVLAKRAGGKPPHIIVRPAKAGEKLVTLDKVERELTPEILVIADEVGPIALAGVMGGLETEVSAATTNVLLEAASFDYVGIRRTMRALNLPSEASMRFSKGVHPEMVKPAAARAAQLMQKHANGSVCAGEVDCYLAKPTPQAIALKASEIERLLGVDVPAAEVERVLTALEFAVEPGAPATGTWKVTAPGHRLDLQEGAADLIEDLARIGGYDRLPATLLSEPLPQQLGNLDLMLEERVKDRLVECGLQEVATYALTTPAAEAPLEPGAPATGSREYVTLVNPISAERVAMRRTLLAGVLSVAAHNLGHAPTVKLFEIGPVFLPKAGEKLPEEPRRLAMVLAGQRGVGSWQEPTTKADLDFYDLKGVLEALAAELHVPDVSFGRSAVAWLHPGKAAELRVAETPVGHFGELHPRAATAWKLGGRSVLVAELDLDALLAKVPERHRYRPVPTFPPALRDVAVVVPDATTADQIVAELRAAGGDLLREARLFDVYRGSSIPEGTKSLAYSLVYQSNEKTLTDKDVDKAHKRIEDRLKHVLKAQIRGKEGG